LSIWTIFTSGFDLYCLHEANPGSSHTGYYIISFDFVYVGNYDGKIIALFVILQKSFLEVEKTGDDFYQKT
jgi:hypothetical protein